MLDLTMRAVPTAIQNVFFSENHLHRSTVCINVLFSMRTHRSVTAILCSGKFSSNYAVYELVCLTVDHFIVRFLWKIHTNFWEDFYRY